MLVAFFAPLCHCAVHVRSGFDDAYVQSFLKLIMCRQSVSANSTKHFFCKSSYKFMLDFNPNLKYYLIGFLILNSGSVY